MIPNPKYPHVVVQLTDLEGNAHWVLARVSAALRRAHIPGDEIENFQDEAMSSDYDHLLRVVQQTVTVE